MVNFFSLAARICLYFLLWVEQSECNRKIGSVKKSKDVEGDLWCKILCSLLCIAQKIREFQYMHAPIKKLKV